MAAVLGQREGILDLTGAAQYTFGDICAEVGELLGVEIPYENTDDDAYRQLLLDAGDSELLADAVSGLGKAIRTGYFDVLTDTAEQLLGRPPTSLRDVLRQNEDELRRALPVTN